MRTTIYRLGLAALVIGLSAALFAVNTDADVEEKQVARVKDVMNAINHEEHGFYGMIKKFVASNPEKGDAGWKINQSRAIVMAEMGNLLMRWEPTQGDAASWKAKSAAFRDAAADLRKALAFKKLDKCATELQAVQKTCDDCHTAHRPQ